jgi:hypothetical protein
MATLQVSPLLRFALRLDAAATFATALPMCFASGALAGWTALPQALLFGAGLFMLGYAAVVGGLSRRATLPRWAVWTVIVGNALWALDCAALAFVGVVSPSALGVAFLLVQAVIVFAFAELQFVGLRRSADAR